MSGVYVGLLLLFLTGRTGFAAPMFYRDVLPVLQQHCQSCHRPGEIGPMPLVDYDGARKWASAIRQAVSSRKMPPWFADPHVGSFRNDRRLSDTDIRTITNWVDAGAPAGNASDAPKPVDWVEGWAIGKPESIFQMPVNFDVPESGVIPYQYVIVPSHFDHDTWVRLAEVRPGDRAHVHHIIVSVREPGSPWLRNEPAGIPFTLKRGDVSASAAPGELLAGHGPGTIPESLEPGQAKLVKAGSDLVFQVHYTTNGKAGHDRSRIGVIFSRDIPRQRVLMLAAANIHFLIPPGDPDYRVEASVTLQHESTLIYLLPHMHLRGKSFEFRARFPDGETQALLAVPHYSYGWQLSYYLRDPIKLPAGTAIECTAHFDNSSGNPDNPDPTKAVRFGAQSWDEMMIGYFEVAVDLNIGMRELLLPGMGTHTM
jgi:hypothetical protein